MKIELTDKLEMFMREAFPCLVKAEEAIYEVTGVTLEQMRSGDRSAIYTCARAVFFQLCKRDVQQVLYLASYLNRDHSSGYYYYSKYHESHEFDAIYIQMLDKVTKVFKNK